MCIVPLSLRAFKFHLIFNTLASSSTPCFFHCILQEYFNTALPFQVSATESICESCHAAFLQNSVPIKQETCIAVYTRKAQVKDFVFDLFTSAVQQYWNTITTAKAVPTKLFCANIETNSEQFMNKTKALVRRACKALN